MTSSDRMPPFNAKRLARGLIRAADRDPGLLRRNMEALPAVRPSTEVAGGQVEELVSIAVVAAQQAADALREARRSTTVARRGLALVSAVGILGAGAAAGALVQYQRAVALRGQLSDQLIQLDELQATANQIMSGLQTLQTAELQAAAVNPMSGPVNSRIVTAQPLPPPHHPAHFVYYNVAASHAHAEPQGLVGAIGAFFRHFHPAPPSTDQGTMVPAGDG